ncbi:MAG: hypothetical protein IPG23_14955 [Burkholderiales bacterium]|nr:hypothetical protein [Burkholderiales bacterium]
MTSPSMRADGTASFTVTLSAVSAQTITVAYNTTDGTATAGADYTSATGTLTFAPGTTAQTISVPITNDTVFEGATGETFSVNLASPTNATIADPWVPAPSPTTTAPPPSPAWMTRWMAASTP